jgi:hypothetical protein
VVLALHQFQRFVGILVVERHGSAVVHVDCIAETMVELYESHNAVVDEGYELRADTFAHQ